MEFVFEPIECEIAFAKLPKPEAGDNTYEDFLHAMTTNVNPNIFQKVMGAPKLHGDYVLFHSPFKALETGELDKTGSLVFKWSTGEWWDNSVGKELLQRSQGSNYGTMYRFFAFFGQSVNISENFDKATRVLKYNASLEKKHISREKNLPAGLIYQHYHSQMIHLPAELLANKKPFWAMKIDQLRTLEGIGYDVERRRLLFFSFGQNGISNMVQTYPLDGSERVYVTLDKLVSRTSDETSSISGNLFVVSPDFETYSVRNFQTEEFSRETVFFTEGQPDAITLALCGFHAASFKNQVHNGEIRANSPLPKFRFVNAYTFADVGAENEAKIFAEVLSATFPDSKYIELKPEYFGPMSMHKDNEVLRNNTDVTNLIEEKVQELGLQKGPAIIIDLLRDAITSKAAQVAYNPEAIIPIGNTAEEKTLREERKKFSWEKAEHNRTTANQENVQGKIANFVEQIYNGRDSRTIELGVYSDASLHDSITSVKGILQRATNTVEIFSYRFNCSDFVSGNLSLKDCVGCPVFKTRRDLARISTSWIQQDDFRDIPPFEGIWRMGSNAEKRLLGLNFLQDKRRALGANGIRCSEAHIQNERIEDTFTFSIGAGSVKAVLDPSCRDSAKEMIQQNLGLQMEVLGFFAPMWDDNEYATYFVIMDVQESKEVQAADLLDAKDILQDQNFSVANIAKIKKSFPDWKLESAERAVFLSAVDFMRVAGYYAPYHVVISLFVAGLSGVRVAFPEYFGSEYIGTSFFVYGEASSGKTYLSKIALMLMHSANSGTNLSNLRAGEFRSSSLKRSSFAYGATLDSVHMKRDPAPLQVKHDGNFLVIDEVTESIPGLTHDAIGQILWEGVTTRAGILNDMSTTTTDAAQNNVESKTPFIFLANISNLSVSKSSNLVFVEGRDENYVDTKFAVMATQSISRMWRVLGLTSPDMAYKRILPISTSRTNSHGNFCQWKLHGFDQYVPFAKRSEVISESALRELIKGFWTSFAYLKSKRVPYCRLKDSQIAPFVEQITSRKYIEGVAFDPLSIRRRVIAFANLCSALRGDDEIVLSDMEEGTKLLSYVLEQSNLFAEYSTAEQSFHDKSISVGAPYEKMSIRATDVHRIPYTFLLERRTNAEREQVYSIIESCEVSSKGIMTSSAAYQRKNIEKLLELYLEKFPEHAGMTLRDFLHVSNVSVSNYVQVPIETHLALLKRVSEIERMSNLSIARWAKFPNYEKCLEYYSI